jgi:hypothetical protein
LIINTFKSIILEMKSPSTPTKPVIQNETDSYNVAASLQERLANANKSSSSLRSLNQKNGRSTPNLSSGAQGSDTNSVHHHTEDDGSYCINFHILLW